MFFHFVHEKLASGKGNRIYAAFSSGFSLSLSLIPTPTPTPAAHSRSFYNRLGSTRVREIDCPDRRRIRDEYKDRASKMYVLQKEL